AGADPVPGPKCTAGCTVKPGPDECTVDPCKCTNGEAACGSAFPDSCKLDKTSLYKCTGGKGSDPRDPVKCESGECIAQPGDDVCKPVPPNNCKCKDAEAVCGSVYLDECKFDKDTLYTCSAAGADPVPGPKCVAGCLIKPGPDECAPDPCKCTNGEATCGSVFPDSCKLDKDTLYTCSAAGADPAAGTKCKDGCEVKDGPDVCKDICACQDNKVQCGSSLPKNCGYTESAVYDCTAGAGTKPILVKVCPPGLTCVNNAEGANCGGEECKCKGGMTVCSSQFPDECKLEKNTIYRCSTDGTPVKVETCPTDKECVAVADGAVCMSKDCKCPDDGTICGAVFPLSCKLQANSLYSCKKGESPVLAKDCLPGTCVSSVANMKAAMVFEAAAADDKCVDPCLCPEAGPICGKSFNATCGLDATALYDCAAA
ncbi:hypothetical protein BGZ94_005819, partial [Podila epigama]